MSEKTSLERIEEKQDILLGKSHDHDVDMVGLRGMITQNHSTMELELTAIKSRLGSLETWRVDLSKTAIGAIVTIIVGAAVWILTHGGLK